MMSREHVIAALQQQFGPSRELDRQIALATGRLHIGDRGRLYRIDPDDGGHVYGGNGDDILIPYYTSDLHDALSLVPVGFYWTCGLCELTGHATIGPDYNGRHREQLLKEWPEDRFHEGFSEDLAPGDGVHRVCIAISITALRALRRPAPPADDGSGS